MPLSGPTWFPKTLPCMLAPITGTQFIYSAPWFVYHRKIVRTSCFQSPGTWFLWFLCKLADPPILKLQEIWLVLSLIIWCPLLGPFFPMSAILWVLKFRQSTHPGGLLPWLNPHWHILCRLHWVTAGMSVISCNLSQRLAAKEVKVPYSVFFVHPKVDMGKHLKTKLMDYSGVFLTVH